MHKRMRSLTNAHKHMDSCILMDMPPPHTHTHTDIYICTYVLSRIDDSID